MLGLQRGGTTQQQRGPQQQQQQQLPSNRSATLMVSSLGPILLLFTRSIFLVNTNCQNKYPYLLPQIFTTSSQVWHEPDRLAWRAAERSLARVPREETTQVDGCGHVYSCGSVRGMQDNNLYIHSRRCQLLFKFLYDDSVKYLLIPLFLLSKLFWIKMFVP